LQSSLPHTLGDSQLNTIPRPEDGSIDQFMKKKGYSNANYSSDVQTKATISKNVHGQSGQETSEFIENENLGQLIGQSIGFSSPPTNQQTFKFGRSQEERVGTQKSG
jgi:hypothetical protein